MWLFDTNAIIDARNFIEKPFQKENHFITIFSVIEFPITIVKYKEISVIYPTRGTYTQALDNAEKLLALGTPIPTIDIIIGTIAVEHKLVMVTNDKHFDFLKAGVPKLNLIGIEDYFNNFHNVSPK